ncbi:SAM-dependent methyltransferase [Flavivirga algicola]|uniref:Phytanoyl-CoA dioxygenase n=1 Tax=Flavivirga algicola TaxID=2729136 RepID=A0ABX1RT59_9FLAO|nr:phytanoyl-CoA dioxygenase [Flavivirga algicola]NMH86745.1 phytanoyl-CoA dioxygenase [Flavivirga algicola]
MTKKKSILDIKKLSFSLLKEPYNQTEIEKSVNEIYVLFQKITEITDFDTKIEYLAAVPTAKGKALGLNHAAQCLLDYKRTVKFLKAVVMAIQEKQKAYPDELINIFYAGCGPYAPFVTLVAPLFSSNNVQFSLLEINKNSLESAKKLIESLELSNYIKATYLADAVTFKVPNPDIFHILISETLDALLYRECYVPIVFNLLPQFDKNIALIPENVCLNLTFKKNSSEETTHATAGYQEHKAGKILDVREAVSNHNSGTSIPSHLPDKEFDLKSMGDYHSILIDTEVHIHNNIKLFRGESSLTLPFEMTLEPPFKDNAIIFTYHMEHHIELKYRLN